MIKLPELKAMYGLKGTYITSVSSVLTITEAEESIRRCKAYEGLVEALNNLSKWAAAIHWNRKKNTQDWIDGLKERIEIAEKALMEAKTQTEKEDERIEAAQKARTGNRKDLQAYLRLRKER